MKNPYAGSELELAWQSGFVAGFLVPSEPHPAPLVFPEGGDIVYAEGVLAGSELHKGMRLLSASGEAEHFSLKHAAVNSIEVLHWGHAVHKVFRATALGAAAEHIAVALLATIVLHAITPEPVLYFDEAAQAALNRLRLELTEPGVLSTNIELFMAACDLPGHDLGDADELTRRGWWHGTVYLDFGPALQEAKNHSHPGDTKVLRYQTMSPDCIDIIEL